MHWLQKNNDSLIVRPESLLMEWDNRDKLQEIFDILDEGINKLVLDLSLMDILNSVGISFLISLRKRSDEHDIHFEMQHNSPRIDKLLSITRLDKYLMTGTH